MLHAEKAGEPGMRRHVKNVTMMYCDVLKRSQKNRSKKAGYSELRFDSSYPTTASTKPRRVVLHSYLRLDALSLTRYEEERSELC